MKGGKKRVLIGLIGVFFFLTFLPDLSYTQIPQQINYQGYLTNAVGVPVNGPVNMTFRIFDVSLGGSSLWTETQNNVPVSYGVYNVTLGSQTPINLSFNVPYFLEIEIGGEVLSPRRAITSVGYAFRALTVETIGNHTHNGADITMGTISEAYIDSTIARDSEVTTEVNAHATRTDNPHSTTAAQVGAVALNQPNSIITSMITDSQVTQSKLSATGGTSGQFLGTDGTNLVWQNTGDITGVIAGTGLTGGGNSGSVTLDVQVPLSLSGSVLLGGVLSGSNSNNSGFGVQGVASGTSGAGVLGSATATGSVENYGGYFEADGESGRGVYGHATGSSGIGVYGSASVTGSATNYGGYFTAAGNIGRGVYGSATAIGAVTNYGGLFSAAGNSGYGVYGTADATGNVTNYGGFFRSHGNLGTGVFGWSLGSSGYGVRGSASADGAITNYGGYFHAAGDSGRGVSGVAWATGDVANYGGDFTAAGDRGYGVYGSASATGDVTNYGGYFTAAGDSGRGVYGTASATGEVFNYGGYFTAAGDYGYGVRGIATSTGNPISFGGLFEANSDNGRGVEGRAPGIYGIAVTGRGERYDFVAAGPGIDYGSESSIRWKRNIVEIKGALDKVMNLRGVYFDWDEEHGGKHDIGFIAEEVGIVIPEIVAYEPDGVYATGIDYGAITPMLVQAIKEQQKQIEELKAIIEELRKKLN
jgi:hypothetical protein